VNKSWPVRALRSFAQFWWDFLVGETPELFVAAIVILGAVALASLVGHDNALALVLLPLLCVVALGASLLRAWRASGRS
jgi:hypothetical protein